MRSRQIVVGACLAAAALIFILSSSVFGCLVDEQDGCRQLASPVRISALGGGKGNAAVFPQIQMVALKADLLQFVDRTANPSWSTQGLEEAGRTPESRAGIKVVHLTPVFGLATLTDSALAETRTKLLLQDANPNLIQARQLAALDQAIARREQERLARARQLAALAAKKKAEAAAHAPAPVIPGSADPYNAPAPSGQPVYIAPMTSVWYGVSDRGRRLTMWMDANKQTGLDMAIYGPDQQDVWSARPVGKAAPDEGHDFFWTGRSRFKGVWRVRITNANDFSVPYTLTATAVSDKNGDLCRDCHGVIEDEWDRCEHEGSFCEDLKDQYAN